MPSLIEQQNKESLGKMLSKRMTGLEERMNQLEKDFREAMKAINQALDQLEAPPEREEAPIIKRLQLAIEDLEERTNSLKNNQHDIYKRICH